MSAEPRPAARMPLVVIIGATGTGKTEFSLDLAQRLERERHRAEIVNADAMQLYRGMDIGTAKVAPDDRRGIPHHELDVLDVRQEASVADYQHRARATITEIETRGNVAMLVGGSGLYVSSVIQDFRFPGTDPQVRARLEEELAHGGPGALHRRLQGLDPEAARAIGAHNGRRLVRALEVIELTGEPFGSGLPEHEQPWHDNVLIVGLGMPRPELVARLDARARQMWNSGLLEEVQGLLPLGLAEGVTASRAIGYSQAIAQLEGRLNESEAIEQTTVLTRKYARRQVSWFRRYRDVLWLDAQDPSRLDTAWEQLTRGHK